MPSVRASDAARDCDDGSSTYGVIRRSESTQNKIKESPLQQVAESDGGATESVIQARLIFLCKYNGRVNLRLSRLEQANGHFGASAGLGSAAPADEPCVSPRSRPYD